MLVHAFLEQDAVIVASQLLGWRLYRNEPTGLVGGIIVETEAYTQSDAASHSYRGTTPRTKTMFGPAGHLYVYFTYGMHYCVNIVTGPAGSGQGVLIRALLPDQGLPVMRSRRNRPDSELTNGPAKLCQALGISKLDNGQPLNEGGIILLEPLKPITPHPPSRRIGISKNTDALWRFTAEV